jgi:hypothetical protein
MDQSVALEQFPIRQGHLVWGWDLIAVSGPADVLAYLGYLVVLAGLLYIACVRRQAHARARFVPIPGWLGRQKTANRSGDRPGA